jgi:hypothetical protein
MTIVLVREKGTFINCFKKLNTIIMKNQVNLFKPLSVINYLNNFSSNSKTKFMNRNYLRIALMAITLLGSTAYNSFAASYRTATSGNWTAAIWERLNGANWNATAQIPAGTDDVFILSGHTVTLTGSLTFSGNGSLDNIGTIVIPTGLTLTMSDVDLVNNGIINGDGKLVYAGTAINIIDGDGTINNFEITKTGVNGQLGIQAGNTQSITGVLTLTSGTIVTNPGSPGAYLALKSTATSTAAVAPIATVGGGTINGDIIVERYFKNKRAWRLVSMPVGVGSTSAAIFDQYQNGGTVGTGVEIWGSNGTGAAGNGLAWGGGYSIKSHTSTGWSPVTNTKTTNITTGAGATEAPTPFLLFVTGSYGSGFINSGSQEATVTAKGTLLTGNRAITRPVSAAGFAMIPNPYPCAVDLEAVGNNVNTGISNTFYVWDANLNDGGYNIGGYVTLQRNATTGVLTPSVAGTYRYLQSGQAFFASKTTGPVTSVVVNFDETDKTTVAANNTSTYLRTNNGNQESLRFTLYGVPANASPYLADGAVINCHQSQYSNSFIESEDGLKMSNAGSNLFVWNGANKISVEGRELFDNGDVVALGMTNLDQQNYELQIAPSNMNVQGLTATLHDAYLGTTQTVDLSNTTSYGFTVNSDPASASSTRFTITFAAAPLAVNNVVKNTAAVSAYPNPAIGNDVKVQISNLDKGTYSLSVYNTVGQLMTQQSFTHNGGAATESVNVSKLAPGAYDVKVSNGDFEAHAKIIKQ